MTIGFGVNPTTDAKPERGVHPFLSGDVQQLGTAPTTAPTPSGPNCGDTSTTESGTGPGTTSPTPASPYSTPPATEHTPTVHPATTASSPPTHSTPVRTSSRRSAATLASRSSRSPTPCDSIRASGPLPSRDPHEADVLGATGRASAGSKVPRAKNIRSATALGLAYWSRLAPHDAAITDVLRRPDAGRIRPRWCSNALRENDSGNRPDD